MITTNDNIDITDYMIYAPALQKLYINYVRKMVREEFILSPRAFFIYITGRVYNSRSLVAKVKELIDVCDKLDPTPTEMMGGKHIVALRIFISC